MADIQQSAEVEEWRVRREFTQKVKVQAFELAGGKCQTCGLKIRGGAEYDHIIPCALGGEASLENCAVLCSACHRRKTSGEDVPRISKAKRIHAKRIGAWKSAYPPIRSRGFPKRREMDPDT